MRRRVEKEFQKFLIKYIQNIFFLLLLSPYSASQEQSKSVEKVTKVGNEKTKEDFPFYLTRGSFF